VHQTTELVRPRYDSNAKSNAALALLVVEKVTSYCQRYFQAKV